MFSPRRMVFWLSVALQGVDALNAAAPYEMVYLYNAYKMEYLTVPAGSRKIAPGCSHTPYTGNPAAPLALIAANTNAASIAQGVVGICTFNEFMQHVQTNAWRAAMRNKERPALGPANVATINDPLTRTLDPDADRLATAVNDPATIGQNRLFTMPVRLYSTADLTLMGGSTPHWNVPWSKQLEKASSVVEAARKEMANRLRLDPTNPALKDLASRFEKWVSTAIDNLSTIHQFRSGDMSRFLVPDQQAHVSWTSSPMSTRAVIDDVQYRQTNGNPSRLIRNAGGAQVVDTTYQVVNFQDSFNAASAASTPLSRAQKIALRDFVAAYGTIPNSIEKAHRDVIDTVKFARDLHQKPITTSFLDSLGGCLSCCVVQ